MSESKSFNTLPKLERFSGFLNWVETHKFNGKLVLKVNADVSHNPGGERKQKGVRMRFNVEVPHTHPANELVAELISKGKIVDGKGEKGLKLFFRGGGMAISHHPWQRNNKEGETEIMEDFRVTLAPWSEVTDDPSRKNPKAEDADAPDDISDVDF